MGNKNTNLPKGPEAEATQRDEGELISSATESVSRDESQGPPPELLASLQSLGENNDYTLLPHSLHQIDLLVSETDLKASVRQKQPKEIAEAYSLKQDYQWAIQFLQLEKLYHERLLSNLTVLQENWESQWREKDSGSSLPSETDGMSEKHFETLSQMCRSHLRPSISVEQQNKLNTTLADVQTKALQPHHDEANTSETTHQEEVKEHSLILEHSSPQTGREEEDGDTCEEGQEVEEEEEEEQCEETPEEEEVKVEWPTGVPQASDKDLAKLSHKEGNSSPDGLVSILKRRRASLDGLPPPSNTTNKQNSKRKVRFSEPEDGSEHDEVGGDSCLILLLLCLVTVVISVGGTALYCTLLDTYSNICTDFTHNVDFYVMNVRRLVEGLGRWLPFRT